MSLQWKKTAASTGTFQTGSFQWNSGTAKLLVFQPCASSKLFGLIGWLRDDFPDNRNEQGGILIGKCGCGKTQIGLGLIVKLKKKHPCGSFEWEILRVGADFRLRCEGCGHIIMTERRMVEKNTKGLRKRGDSGE